LDTTKGRLFDQSTLSEHRFNGPLATAKRAVGHRRIDRAAGCIHVMPQSFGERGVECIAGFDERAKAVGVENFASARTFWLNCVVKVARRSVIFSVLFLSHDDSLSPASVK